MRQKSGVGYMEVTISSKLPKDFRCKQRLREFAISITPSMKRKGHSRNLRRWHWFDEDHREPGLRRDDQPSSISSSVRHLPTMSLIVSISVLMFYLNRAYALLSPHRQIRRSSFRFPGNASQGQALNYLNLTASQSNKTRREPSCWRAPSWKSQRFNKRAVLPI